MTHRRQYKNNLICGICLRSNILDNAKFNTVSIKVLTLLKIDKLCIDCKKIHQPEAVKQIKTQEAKQQIRSGKRTHAYKRHLANQ